MTRLLWALLAVLTGDTSWRFGPFRRRKGDGTRDGGLRHA